MLAESSAYSACGRSIRRLEAVTNAPRKMNEWPCRHAVRIVSGGRTIQQRLSTRMQGRAHPPPQRPGQSADAHGTTASDRQSALERADCAGTRDIAALALCGAVFRHKRAHCRRVLLEISGRDCGEGQQKAEADADEISVHSRVVDARSGLQQCPQVHGAARHSNPDTICQLRPKSLSRAPHARK